MDEENGSFERAAASHRPFVPSSLRPFVPSSFRSRRRARRLFVDVPGVLRRRPVVVERRRALERAVLDAALRVRVFRVDDPVPPARQPLAHELALRGHLAAHLASALALAVASRRARGVAVVAAAVPPRGHLVDAGGNVGGDDHAVVSHDAVVVRVRVDPRARRRRRRRASTTAIDDDDDDAR
eukprot:19246-Pelagococcus_subviridis.AAC.2